MQSPVLVAHTQLDYAAAVAPAERARELVDSAARIAAVSELRAVARRVAELRDAQPA